MPGAAHLHATQAQLDVRLAFLEVPQDEDAVGEELLVEGRELAVVPRRDLGDEEARRPEGLQKPKKWNRSRRGCSRWLRLYRAARLSIATRSKRFTRTRWSMYFRRTSSQFFDSSSSLCSRRILPMSRTYSSIVSRPVMPSSDIAARRSSWLSSREMYRAFDPAFTFS